MSCPGAHPIRVIHESVRSDNQDHQLLLEEYSLVYQLDPVESRYQELLGEFFAKWSKPNTTGLMVEAILKVFPSRVQKDRFQAYKRLLSTDLDPAILNEKVLFHGTHSCLPGRIFDHRLTTFEKELDSDDEVCLFLLCWTDFISLKSFYSLESKGN